MCSVDCDGSRQFAHIVRLLHASVAMYRCGGGGGGHMAQQTLKTIIPAYLQQTQEHTTQGNVC